ncbi:MAG: type I 3-dehydroquinate dehydratase [Promethearchaeati archaeon]
MNPYKICIAIPIRSSSVEENRKVLFKVENHSPDFIELRFDYIQDPNNLTFEFIRSLLDYSDIPMICTFRKYSEGGHCKITDSERISIIKTIIKATPEFLDIEMDNSIDFIEEVVSLAAEKNIRLIFSHHNFTDTPKFKDMQKIISSFKLKLHGIQKIYKNFLNNFVWKLIFTANKFEDNLEVLKLCNTMAHENENIISFCMGEIGIFSRLLSVKMGGFLTYASLDDKTAPGQINIDYMRKFYKIFQN